jgi:hypothetical protein
VLPDSGRTSNGRKLTYFETHLRRRALSKELRQRLAERVRPLNEKYAAGLSDLF